MTEASTTIYKYTGEAILTLQSTTRGAKYIQDETGAILIDDNSGIITNSIAVGDKITGFIGNLNLYNGMLQLIPAINSGTVVSSGNTITPKAVALADLKNYPAQYVEVNNLNITGSGTFAQGTSYNLNGSNNPVLRPQYAGLSCIGEAIPSTPQKITGVVLLFGTTTQFVPISMSDATPVAMAINETDGFSGVTVNTMANVALTRTFNGDGWNTLCLPYAINDPEAIFGSGTEVYEFTGYDSESEAILFTKATTMEAHVPCLIKVATIQDRYAFNNVCIEPGTPEKNNGDATMAGVYAANETVPSGSYFINTDKFWLSTGVQKILPFRAYFTTTGSNGAKVLEISLDGVTGVDDIVVDETETVGNIYTIGGQLVRKNTNNLDGLAKGIYIVNGNKVIVK